MDAEQRAVLRRHQHLEHAVGVAQDLAPGQLPVPGDAHLVGDGRVGQLGLGPPHEADLRDRVDPDGQELLHVADLLSKRVQGGDAPLLHGRRGQAGEPDHVAHRVDVRDLGPEAGTHPDAAPVVGLQTGPSQVEGVGGALPAR